MFGMTRCDNMRASTFAFICFMAIAGASSAAFADEGALDTSRLPRIGTGKEIFASAAATIFTAPDSVSVTAVAVGAALAAKGWQRYVAPFTEQAKDPNMSMQSFKKGSQALSVMVNIAPAQGNATSVSYSVMPLATDLPFPKDASAIEFDSTRPLLTCVTAANVDVTLDFFGSELISQGWSPWSGKDGAKQAPGAPVGEKTENGAYVYFIKENKMPLLLVLQRGKDGQTTVELKGIPAEELPAPKKPKVAAANTQPAVTTEAKTQPDSLDTKIDDLAGEIIKQATADALAGVKPTAKTPSTGEPDTILNPLAGNTAPIPVPETAESVEFNGPDGTIEFNIESSVKSVAAFYRAAMKPLGWKEQKSVINRLNMVALDFSKGGKDVSITIMQMGQSVNVNANGSGLVTASAEPQSSDTEQASKAPAADTEQVLEAEDAGGLPVPKQHTLSTSSQSPFRVEANANVSAGVDAVLAFYRRELGKRDWKEEAQSAVVAADHATLKFTTADGPAILKVSRKDNETTIDLAVRKTADATKSGLMPKAGQVKLLLGNMLDGESAVTINKKTIKVPAHAGSKGPDGPSLEVAPGKYKFAIKSAGKPAQNDEVEVGADEIWGLLIGPGGALAIQMY